MDNRRREFVCQQPACKLQTDLIWYSETLFPTEAKDKGWSWFWRKRGDGGRYRDDYCPSCARELNPRNIPVSLLGKPT